MQERLKADAFHPFFHLESAMALRQHKLAMDALIGRSSGATSPQRRRQRQIYFGPHIYGARKPSAEQYAQRAAFAAAAKTESPWSDGHSEGEAPHRSSSAGRCLAVTRQT